MRIRGAQPNARIRPLNPSVRTSSFQTGVLTQSTVNILAGTPIGLLLALTYATDQMSSLTYRGDLRPNARITN